MGYLNTRSIGLLIIVIVILIVAIYCFTQMYKSDEERYANKHKLIVGVSVATLLAIVGYYFVDNAHHQKHHHHHGKHHAHKHHDAAHHDSHHQSALSNSPPRVNPTIL